MTLLGKPFPIRHVKASPKGLASHRFISFLEQLMRHLDALKFGSAPRCFRRARFVLGMPALSQDLPTFIPPSQTDCNNWP